MSTMDEDDEYRHDEGMKNNHNDNGDDDDDGDEEDDEDYIPGADPDENEIDDDDGDVGGGDDDVLHGPTSHALSIAGRRAADEAFYELFGYPYQWQPEEGSMQPAPSTTSTTTTPTKNRRAIHILSTIFGKRSTSTLLSNSKFNAKFARPKDRASSGGMIRLERRVIYEIKRFAGREIKVEKVVLVPVFANEVANNNMPMTTSTTAAAGICNNDGRNTTTSTNTSTDTSFATTTTTTTTTRGPTKRGGLDNLLTQISRPDKLSTMSKTAADWDMFKSTNVDLATKLEDTATGNEAYLVKKDFLNRVDTRQFELEKAQRERERAARR